MAKSGTQRHMEWRQRVAAKAKLFDEVERYRKKHLQELFDQTPCNNGAAAAIARKALLESPYCWSAPCNVYTQNGVLIVGWDSSADSYSMAVVHLHLRKKYSELLHVPEASRYRPALPDVELEILFSETEDIIFEHLLKDGR